MGASHRQALAPSRSLKGAHGGPGNGYLRYARGASQPGHDSVAGGRGQTREISSSARPCREQAVGYCAGSRAWSSRPCSALRSPHLPPAVARRTNRDHSGDRGIEPAARLTAVQSRGYRADRSEPAQAPAEATRPQVTGDWAGPWGLFARSKKEEPRCRSSRKGTTWRTGRETLPDAREALDWASETTCGDGRPQVLRPARDVAARVAPDHGVRRGRFRRRARLRRLLHPWLAGHSGLGHAAHAGRVERDPRSGDARRRRCRSSARSSIR